MSPLICAISRVLADDVQSAVADATGQRYATSDSHHFHMDTLHRLPGEPPGMHSIEWSIDPLRGVLVRTLRVLASPSAGSPAASSAGIRASEAAAHPVDAFETDAERIVASGVSDGAFSLGSPEHPDPELDIALIEAGTAVQPRPPGPDVQVGSAPRSSPLAPVPATSTWHIVMPGSP
jgi:hypothetical protein